MRKIFALVRVTRPTLIFHAKLKNVILMKMIVSFCKFLLQNVDENILNKCPNWVPPRGLGTSKVPGVEGEKGAGWERGTEKRSAT